ncbi:3-dehydroquinate synthase family protein, partial [Chlamydia psittaci 06-1683]
GSTEFTKP